MFLGLRKAKKVEAGWPGDETLDSGSSDVSIPSLQKESKIPEEAFKQIT